MLKKAEREMFEQSKMKEHGDLIKLTEAQVAVIQES
jgi:hypothetical protein